MPRCTKCRGGMTQPAHFRRKRLQAVLDETQRAVTLVGGDASYAYKAAFLALADAVKVYLNPVCYDCAVNGVREKGDMSLKVTGGRGWKVIHSCDIDIDAPVPANWRRVDRPYVSVADFLYKHSVPHRFTSPGSVLMVPDWVAEIFEAHMPERIKRAILVRLMHVEGDAFLAAQALILAGDIDGALALVDAVHPIEEDIPL